MEGKHTFISYEDVLKMDLEDEAMESTQSEEERSDTSELEETKGETKGLSQDEKDYIDALVMQLEEAKRKNSSNTIQIEKRELARTTSTTSFVVGVIAGAVALGAGYIAYDYISNRNSNIVIE